MENEAQEKKTVLAPFTMIIPKCCREGLDSCKHVAKKVKPKKLNVGL
jgi:hypothetical protein